MVQVLIASSRLLEFRVQGIYLLLQFPAAFFMLVLRHHSLLVRKLGLKLRARGSILKLSQAPQRLQNRSIKEGL